MSPDPPVDPVDGCLSCNYDLGVVLHSSDESDNETEQQLGYDGYTLLGQQELVVDPEDTNDVEGNESMESQENEINCQTSQEDFAAGQAELIALWNMPATPSSGGIRMDDERSAQIRAAMAGFSLPASSVPAWAANIPEDEWKQRILDRLKESGPSIVTPKSLGIGNKSSAGA